LGGAQGLFATGTLISQEKNRSFDVKSTPKHRLPIFLEQNREERPSIQLYAREHLPELSIKRMSEHIHDKLIPTMLKLDVMLYLQMITMMNLCKIFFRSIS
jgi:hypothetical protein